MNLENILTSGFDFSEDESRLKYRFTLVNSMFVVGIAIALLAAVIRLFLGKPLVSLLDVGLALSFFGGLLYLRRDKKRFEKVTTIQLGAAFFFFTALVLALHENQTKLLWYTLLINATFMIKGMRAGMFTYGVVVATLTLFYIAPQLYPHLQPYIDLHLSSVEIVMALLFFSISSLYMTFATQEHHKSLANLQKANAKIQQQRRQLSHQLRTFPSTRLPNSLALNEQLKTYHPNDSLALITLSIDEYIILADEFGTKVAQEIVLKSAQILKQFTDTQTHLFHVGPYQFSFLFTCVDDAHAIDFARRILRYFESLDISIDDLELSISFSIGIATGTHDTLITHANTALYEAQRSGTNRYKLFVEDKQREEERKNNIYWNRKIKEIINQNKLRLFYQPIVDNKSEQIVKYECLIRAEVAGEIITPFHFLHAARSRGLLPQITRFVIDESFRHFSKSDIEFSINITEEDLKSNFLINYLSAKSQAYNIDPSRVYLEVLENITTDQTIETLSQFDTLRQLGFQIAIDDFGAEASNLSRLLTYKADIIKIDGQFIKNIDTDPNSQKIVETIVSLAHKLGAKTVAEFVHNKTVYHVVKSLGVTFSQGYYLGAPKPDTSSHQTRVKEIA